MGFAQRGRGLETLSRMERHRGGVGSQGTLEDFAGWMSGALDEPGEEQRLVGTENGRARLPQRLPLCRLARHARHPRWKSLRPSPRSPNTVTATNRQSKSRNPITWTTV